MTSPRLERIRLPFIAGRLRCVQESGDAVAEGSASVTEKQNRFRGAVRCSIVRDRIHGVLHAGHFRAGDGSVTSACPAEIERWDEPQMT
jgi:hypothetical protein